MIHCSDKIALIAGDLQLTFTEFLQRVHQLSEQLDIRRGDHVVIYSENCPEWLYALYAIWEKEAIAVPVDAGATEDDLAYILKDSDAVLVLDRAALERLAQVPAEAAEPAVVPYRPQDTALICYTSGTTGSPKGVMLSFENMMANVWGVSRDVPIYTPDRRAMILLPLHHVLPLMGTVVAPMYLGAGVAICPSFSGADIMKTLQEGQVGIFIGVPRLWQTFLRSIREKLDSRLITRILYRLCEKVHSRRFSRLVFKQIREMMGGKIAYIVSGGAALDAQTARGLTVLGLDLLEGYGMTETAPVICFTRPGDLIPGCVGKPLPRLEVKLVDGELCAKGPNLMQGYYKRPEETRAVIDQDGFIHTGDLAEMDSQGHVYITGRRKEIIVLGNGKNINPQEVEEKLELHHEQVKEAAVLQDGDLLRAILVPREEWAVDKSEEEQVRLLKELVLEPYNAGVTPYKRVMALTVYHGELPRTRMEKLQRFRLLAIVNNSSQSSTSRQSGPSSQPSYATPELTLLAHFVEKVKGRQMRPEDNLETDLAFDSLDKVELQGFLERSFGVQINQEELAEYKTMEQLADYVAQQKTKYETDDVDWHSLLQDETVRLQLPRMSWAGRWFNVLCRLVYRRRFGVTVSGLEHVPSGPCILAPNHQSMLDAPLVTMFLSVEQQGDTYFYAKKEHVKNRLSQLLARNYNVIIMDISSLKESIQTLGEALKQGKKVVIFPEGRRTDDGHIGEFKKMFAILSRELDVPVVPVALQGAFEAMPRGRMWPRRHRISVTYLPPVELPKGSYEELTTVVRDALKAELGD